MASATQIELLADDREFTQRYSLSVRMQPAGEAQAQDDVAEEPSLVATKEQRKQAIAKATAINASRDWTKHVEAQGPWDPIKDAVSLKGASSLPMPVKIAESVDLEPLFAHLEADGNHLGASTGVSGVESATNPVPLLEFGKGVVYQDARMDLCKMVVGPTHIDRLLNSLDSSKFVRHFLLGNNIIGPRGARRIARFVHQHPEQMETWYLAGNCIDAESLHLLVKAFISSPAITNVWLKRNQLTPAVANDLFKLITKSPNLRTLDLDQTSLGDAGLANLFIKLGDHAGPIPLRNLYINANGMGVFGAKQLASYLASPQCQLESLYISLNPLGNAGVEAIAKSLSTNRSLLRLSMESVGVSTTGANALCRALTHHRSIKAVNIGTGYQTGDLGGRFNYLNDDVAPAICDLITKSRSLQHLDLGYTAMSATAYYSILLAIAGSVPRPELGEGAQTGARPTNAGLVSFSARPGSVDPSTAVAYRRVINDQIYHIKDRVYGRLLANVRATYG